MSTELQPFAFQSHQLRVLVDDQGIPWFIAKEVADILGYSDASKLTQSLDEDEKQNRQIGGFGPRGVITINESGLYQAILNSKKPEAKVFRKWVTGEVLPSIRKTGGYGKPGNLTLDRELLKQIIESNVGKDAQIGYLTRQNDAEFDRRTEKLVQSLAAAHETIGTLKAQLATLETRLTAQADTDAMKEELLNLYRRLDRQGGQA